MASSMMEHLAEEGERSFTLPILQGLIKKQPRSYEHEYWSQWSNFLTQVELFESAPQSPAQELHTSLMFHVAVGHHYTLPTGENVADKLCETLIELLEKYMRVGRPLTLRELTVAMQQLDTNGHCNRRILYHAYLRLLADESDTVPQLLTTSFINGITKMKNQAESKYWNTTTLNTFKEAMKSNLLLARRLQFIIISIYVKGMWNDRPTANILADGMFSSCTRIVENAARFFLGDMKRMQIAHNTQKKEAELSDDERRRRAAQTIIEINAELQGKSAKTASGLKKLEMMKSAVEKEMSELEERDERTSRIPYVVLEHIYDHTKFCERLNNVILKTGGNKLSFKIRLLLLTVCSRIMAKMEIYIPGFFAGLHKYLVPSVRNCTRVMVVIAEAVNGCVPAEELQVTVRHIADQFCVHSLGKDTICIGLNAIAEICKRNIYSISKELLDDVIRMGFEAAGPCSTAAARIRNIYRENMPTMLPKKYMNRAAGIAMVTGDHAKEGDANLNLANEARSTVDGLDILLRMKAYRRAKKRGMTLDISSYNELLSEKIREVQTTKILTDRDFYALQKLRLKMVAAKKIGVNMQKWLDRNPDVWNSIVRDIFADEEDLDDMMLPEYPEIPNEEGAADAASDDESLGSDDESFDSDSDGELVSDSEDESVGQAPTTSADDDNTVVLTSQTDEEFKLAAQRLSEEQLAEILNADDTDDEWVAGSDEEEGADPEAHRNNYLDAETLGGGKKLDRKAAALEAAEKRIDKIATAKAGRHGTKDRAGMTNRTLARNKPMAMVRQKRQNKDKIKDGIRSKVRGMTKHVKTMKTQLHQKFRSIR